MPTPASVNGLRTGLTQRLGRPRMLIALALFMVVPTAPAIAYDPCAAGYPDPAVTLRQSAYDVKPGEPVWLGGRLARNGCGISGKVGLFLRDRPGGFHWVETRSTNSRGEYTFGRAPRASFDAMVVFSGTSTHRRAISQIHHIAVSSTDDRDDVGFVSCDNQVPLGRRWQPPAGWRLELVGVPSRLQSGSSVRVQYKVTNETDREMRFSTQVNNGRRFVLLQNLRTGERPVGVRHSDFTVVSPIRLQPGQSTTIPGGIDASHCYYRTIHPAQMRTVAWLTVTVRDETQNIEQTVHWYAPPVPVEVVP